MNGQMLEPQGLDYLYLLNDMFATAAFVGVAVAIYIAWKLIKHD